MSDDNEPPATGAAAVSFEPDGPQISMAPTAEPTHRIKPATVI